MSKRLPKKCGRRYPWGELFSKSQFELKKGTDYNGMDYTFCQHLRRAAKRHGYKVSIKLGEGCLNVSVVGRCEKHPEVFSPNVKR